MAINKAMLLALKALSYSEPGLAKTYRLQRAVADVRAPHLLKPFYRLWDREIHCGGRDVKVRIYEPKELERKSLLLFFHGGGWVTESVDTYNNVCKNLAKNTSCRVISVEYSLAPEHPFPEGLEDCYAVAKTLFFNTADFDIPAEEIVLIGDSAGGNLAAAVSLLGRDRGEFCPQKQILLYPAVGNDYSESSPFPSVQENGSGYLLTAKRIGEYMELYAGGDGNRQNPYLAPILMEDLSNQPKTLVITAQYDPLRDEGEAYAERLRAAGGEVYLYRMDDALHGFFSLDPIFSHVKKAYALINRFLSGDDPLCQLTET